MFWFMLPFPICNKECKLRRTVMLCWITMVSWYSFVVDSLSQRRNGWQPSFLEGSLWSQENHASGVNQLKHTILNWWMIRSQNLTCGCGIDQSRTKMDTRLRTTLSFHRTASIHIANHVLCLCLYLDSSTCKHICIYIYTGVYIYRHGSWELNK